MRWLKLFPIARKYSIPDYHEKAESKKKPTKWLKIYNFEGAECCCERL